jgi:hypothetical protein
MFWYHTYFHFDLLDVGRMLIFNQSKYFMEKRNGPNTGEFYSGGKDPEIKKNENRDSTSKDTGREKEELNKQREILVGTNPSNREQDAKNELPDEDITLGIP